MKCNDSGILETFSGQICVPNNDVLRYKLVLEAHEPLFAGHFSERKTLEQIKRHWWWPHMNATVQRVVGNCPIYQYDATKKQRDEGPYKPSDSGSTMGSCDCTFRVWICTEHTPQTHGVLCGM